MLGIYQDSNKIQGGFYMYALFIVLNKTDVLDELLEAFVDIGIQGATILDSQGMASALVGNKNTDIPILGRLRGMVDTSRPYNKTIFTIVPSKEVANRAITCVNTVVGDLHNECTGLAFTLPIDEIFGLKNCALPKSEEAHQH